VQFVDLPGSDWDLLRDRFTNVYENYVNPVPDPNGWFHARIEIDFPIVKVFVNGSAAPSLTVRQISGWKRGHVGLWLDSKDGWFRHITMNQNTKAH